MLAICSDCGTASEAAVGYCECGGIRIIERPIGDAEAQAALILGTLRATVAQWWTDQDRIDLATLRDTYVASLQRSLAA